MSVGRLDRDEANGDEADDAGRQEQKVSYGVGRILASGVHAGFRRVESSAQSV